MPLFSRPDGVPVADASPLRVLMPHLMPGRNGAAVYFEQQLRVEKTLAFLETLPEEDRPGFFHVVLCALIRTLAERPMLNRFVVGRRLYQRRNVELSFAVKKQFSDDGALTTVKVTFSGAETLAEVRRLAQSAVEEGRGARPTTSEKEMRLVTMLPRSLLRLVMWAQRALDYFNLLPATMIRSDPLYASAFLANLGSIGLDAPYHHLFEYGTVPIFIAIGRIQPAPVVEQVGCLAVRKVVGVRYTLDERIADGFYCARSLERFRTLVEDPTPLLAPGKPIAPGKSIA